LIFITPDNAGSAFSYYFLFFGQLGLKAGIAALFKLHPTPGQVSSTVKFLRQQSTADAHLSPAQAVLLVLLARGPQTPVEALKELLPALGAALLSARADVRSAACPGVGPVALGATVVSTQSREGLSRGAACAVVALGSGAVGGGSGTGPTGSLALRRLSDGCDLRDRKGRRRWFLPSELALLGASLEATPLHLACLWGCPVEVVSALVARAPEALSKLDALGRSPLAIAAEVRRFVKFVAYIFIFLHSHWPRPLL